MANLKIDLTPSLQVRSTDRVLQTGSWQSAAYRHWQYANPSQKKKLNVSLDRNPAGTYYFFPSIDPYTGRQRMDFRAIHENVSWINRAVKIMVACEVGWGYTITAEPRMMYEQIDDKLDEWKMKTVFSLPWARQNSDKEEWTVHEIEEFLFNMSVELDLQSHIARAERYTYEQGSCGIMMLPELKYDNEGNPSKNGKFVMPRLLRTIRPEHAVRIWLDMRTGEMDSLQVIGIASNGGRLPAERLIWLTSDANLELNSDYYGESKLLPLLDTGKVMAILYGKDFAEAALHTWHQPKVFQVEIPPRDFKKVDEVLHNFLKKNNNSAGKDIAVTQNVTLVSGQSNPGDLQGLINLDDHLIDQVAGAFNIPPFLLSKGKAGNLGGNAQKEEVDAFLNVEIRPRQEVLEGFLEKQFFDRLLCILFDVQDPADLPIRIRVNFIKPDLTTLFDRQQYEIMLDMVDRKILSEDKMIERLGLENVKRGIGDPSGADLNPRQNILRISRKKNPHWNDVRTGWKNNNQPVMWNNRPMFIPQTENPKNKAPVPTN